MALLISDEIKQEILDRTDLAALVSDVVPLKRIGSRLAGLCPFHADKKPSFYVHAARGFYHCFGCGEHGDAITFLQKTQNLGFVEAVKTLAERAGVRIPESDRPRDRLRESQLELLEAAARFFERSLRGNSGAAVREILANRGLDADTIEKFRIGFAPPGWENLHRYLVRQGARQQDLVRVGLVQERAGGEGAYDRFRNRIIFPIFNRSGRVIAFGGRVVNRDDDPKYLNSPETELFRKSDILYGFNLARQAIQAEKEVLLVEGYMDLIALHQYQFENSVATLGTALTPGHFRLLQPYTERLLLLFDADAAGQRATVRGIDVLFEMDVSPLVMELPGNTDPDSFLRERGAEALHEVRNRAADAFDFRLKMLTAGRRQSSDEEKTRIVKELGPILLRVPNEARKKKWVGRLAFGIDLPEDILLHWMRRLGRSRSEAQDRAELPFFSGEEESVRRAKQGLIALLLDGSPIGPQIRDILAEAPIRDQYDGILEGLTDMLETGESLSRGKLLARFGEESLRLLEEAELHEPVPKNVQKAVSHYCQIVRQGYLLHTQEQTGKEKGDKMGSFDELRREQALAEQRLHLGLGEGFRLPPHTRTQPSAR
jgi:DNA primase